MFSQLQWDIFQLVQQEKKGYREAADTLNLPIKQLRATLDLMRAKEPDLFYCDIERMRLHNAHSGAERKKFNPKIVPLHDIAEQDIKEKY